MADRNFAESVELRSLMVECEKGDSGLRRCEKQIVEQATYLLPGFRRRGTKKLRKMLDPVLRYTVQSCTRVTQEEYRVDSCRGSVEAMVVVEV